MKPQRDENGSSEPTPVRVPRQAHEVFGERLALARQFADLLADTGVSHGLIGPRETPRLWDRHLLNCAVVEEYLPHRTRLIDVGSGAGLPGLVLGIMRPDLEVRLVEPMQRRTRWLESTIEQLGIGNVTVLRGRAQDFRGRIQAQVVTARAVARLAELVPFCLPLVEPGGRLLALKGETAEQELEEDLPALRRMGVTEAEVLLAGADVLSTPTRVIAVTRPGESSTTFGGSPRSRPPRRR